jgi:hypothetical protein
VGADFYLRSITEKAQAEWQPRRHDAILHRDTLPAGPDRDAAEIEVERCVEKMFPGEGHFRDPYNNRSVLRRLGIDVGTDVKVHGEWLAGDNLLRFRALVAEREVPPTTRDLLVEFRCAAVDDDAIEAWHGYFVRRRAELLAFLGRAIASGEPIRVSL